jgi:hypothetical protein
VNECSSFMRDEPDTGAFWARVPGFFFPRVLALLAWDPNLSMRMQPHQQPDRHACLSLVVGWVDCLWRR